LPAPLPPLPHGAPLRMSFSRAFALKGVARKNHIRQVKTTSMKKASKPHPVLIQSVK